MYVRFWGTRGSIPTPGNLTAAYGGNTCCVELRSKDGTTIILDCGTGIRGLGLEILKRPGPQRIHLLITHTHWDHIQGFPFFTPAFVPGAELNIYGSAAFQRNLEDSLSGQMQYSYFPVKLQDLASRIHYTELEEGFFRIGKILVETQYLNHTAPTIAYRISADGAVVVYVTDHEPFWNDHASQFRHPGDQRHIDFLSNADLVVHDAQYTSEEYKSKLGWGHSPVDYVTDAAIAANATKLALFHHDPTHDDNTLKEIEHGQRARASRAGSGIDVFAAAEGMAFDLNGKRERKTILDISALERRRIAGGRVLLVTSDRACASVIDHILSDDGLVLTPASNPQAARELAASNPQDLIIVDAASWVDAVEFIQTVRVAADKSDLPAILLTEDRNGGHSPDAQGSNVTDFFAKPFSPPMLRTRVRAWLARTIGVIGPTDAGLSRDAGGPGYAGNNRAAKQNVLDLLSSMDLFVPLSSEQRARLVERASDKTFPSGHVIIRQDDPAAAAYVVISGRVRVFESNPETPVDMFLGEFGRGGIFGELGTLGHRPSSAAVVALEPTRCLVIPAEDFLAMLQESQEMSMTLLRVLARRLSDVDRLLARYAPDSLTGLPARRAFHEMYRRVSAGCRPEGGVLLLLLDVFRLKQINDRFGYSVGDDVLRTVADALVESSRASDLVARCGGDEFVVLMWQGRVENVEIVIKRVEQKLRQLALYRNLPLEVVCNIGSAFSQDPPQSVDELLRLADEEMHAKASLELK
jgi:diguanylate cyclase (GGDEF)-like protein